jgi:hypothetical protein
VSVARPRFRLSLLLLLAVVSAPSADASRKYVAQELFRIERSTNGNVVRYDARIEQNGELDSGRPVAAYWVLARGGREELNWLERSMAYGFSVSAGKRGVNLRLVAFDARLIAVAKTGDRYRAELSVAGRRAVLRKIWVQADSTLLGPKVRFIELHGTDVTTGAPLVERVGGK